MYKGIIYKYTNKVNHKVYIGQTTRPLARKREHKYAIKRTLNNYFHNALKKYGIDSFIYEIIEEVSSESLKDLYEKLNTSEINWILYYKSDNKKYGYNLSEGGATRRKSKRVYLFDINSNLLKTFRSYKDAGEYLNITNVHHSISNRYLIHGKYYLSDSKDFTAHRKVKSKYKYLQYTTTGELIKEWESIMDTVQFNYDPSCILKCCKGLQKSHKGFIWKRELKNN